MIELSNESEKKFKFVKFLFFFLSLLTCIDIFLLCYNLRPLGWDGARFSFYLINNQQLHSDRLLASFFQIPTFLMQSLFSVKSPLLLLRIYFFTLVFSIYSFMTIRVLKAKNYSELICISSMMFIVLFPALSFTLNVMLETLLFYFLAVEFLLKKKYKFSFFLLILCTFGHPSIIFGFLVLIFIQIWIYYKEKPKALYYYLPGTISLSFVILVRILIEIKRDPVSRFFFRDVILGVIRDFSNQYYSGGIYAGFVFFILSFILIINRKSKYITAYYLAGVTFLGYQIFKNLDPSFLIYASHPYRVFSLAFCIFIVFYMVFSSYFKFNNSEIMVKILFIIFSFGLWNLYRDFQINREQINLNSKLLQKKSNFENCLIHSDIKLKYFPVSSVPILKLFLDDQKTVHTIHYVPENQKDVKKELSLCNQVKFGFIPLDYKLLLHFNFDPNAFYGLYYSTNGYFNFKFNQ